MFSQPSMPNDEPKTRLPAPVISPTRLASISLDTVGGPPNGHQPHRILLVARSSTSAPTYQLLSVGDAMVVVTLSVPSPQSVRICDVSRNSTNQRLLPTLSLPT